MRIRRIKVSDGAHRLGLVLRHSPEQKPRRLAAAAWLVRLAGRLAGVPLEAELE